MKSSDRSSGYGSGYELWKGWAAQDFGSFTSNDVAFYEAQVFSLLCERKSKLLEIGFGNGSFMGCSRARGHDIDGIEINPVLKRRAADAGFQLWDSTAQLPQNAFDAIVAFDVLEHVPQDEIIGLLDDLRASLKPGGLIILRFPNGDSPFGRAYQYGDVTHVTVIGTDKIRYFSHASALDVVHIGNPALALRLVGLHRILLRLAKWSAQQVIEVLLGLIYFGVKRPLAPNLIAVLRRPP